MKSLHFLDLRVKPEDDKSTTRCHSRFFAFVIPAKAGPKATPTGGPEQSEWVSAAHNPKCWKHLYVVIPVKTGIQNAGTRRIIRASLPWISGSSPKMTIKKRPEDDKGRETPTDPKMTEKEQYPEQAVKPHTHLSYPNTRGNLTRHTIHDILKSKEAS